MTKALEYIGDFSQWFIDLFKSLGQIITSVVSILGTCVDYLKNVFSILPGWMYAVVVVLVIVCVLYKVLGREGNA